MDDKLKRCVTSHAYTICACVAFLAATTSTEAMLA
jgi:hypothetical protein